MDTSIIDQITPIIYTDFSESKRKIQKRSPNGNGGTVRNEAKMKHTLDMSKGSPLKALILFSLPIIIGNLFQQFYNLMDIAIVGNKLGVDALAAVGATAALYGLFLSLAYGFTNGFSLVIARYFGAKDKKGLRVAIAHSFMISAGVAIFLTMIAVLFTKPLLKLLRTPDVELSYRYISVVLFCVVFMVFYNNLAGILRAVGNSVVPLIFLIIGSFCNIGMDYIFISYFGLGVFGAGLATVLSQVFSCIMCALYLKNKCRDLLPEKADFAYNHGMMRDLFENGLSMALMFSIVSVGSICLQFAVNNLGPTTVAAHTTARKIDETMMVVFAPLSTACATYCSQNLGAGRTDRIRKGIFTAFALAFGVSLITILVTFLYGDRLVRLVSGSDDPELLRQGTLYLKLNIPFYFFLVALVLLRSSLQGIRYKTAPLIASCVEMIGKVLIALVLVPRIGYMGIIVSEPIIWFTCSIIVGISFVLALKKLSVNTTESLLRKPLIRKMKLNKVHS